MSVLFVLASCDGDAGPIKAELPQDVARTTSR